MPNGENRNKGGVARAKSLSAERKSEIAKLAAEARWGSNIDAAKLPLPVAAADINIGGITIPCAVIEANGEPIRVLSERGVAGALGRTRSGSHWQRKRERGDRLPVYLSADNIFPFISNGLIEALSEPIWYRAPNGGRPVAGVPATCLVEILDTWVAAEGAGVLLESQKKFAVQARLLMRGLGNLGIIGLVDEATGYQNVRSKNELQKILSAYISETLLPYCERFPMTYYQEMFRLWNWKWPPNSGIRGPRYAGKLTKKIIYEQLPPGVLAEIEIRNPRDEKWQRKNKHGQFLTEDTGSPHLEKQIVLVTGLLTAAETKEDFKRMFERNFEGSFPETRQASFLKKLDSSDGET